MIICCLQGEIGDEEFKEYFLQYGEIEDSVVSSIFARLLPFVWESVFHVEQALQTSESTAMQCTDPLDVQWPCRCSGNLTACQGALASLRSRTRCQWRSAL